VQHKNETAFGCILGEYVSVGFRDIYQVGVKFFGQEKFLRGNNERFPFIFLLLKFG
jgi:hypothetical protein